jgi:PheRS DNA binding domain 2
LEAIAAGQAESVPEKDRGEYKKRKLVQVIHELVLISLKIGWPSTKKDICIAQLKSSCRLFKNQLLKISLLGKISSKIFNIKASHYCFGSASLLCAYLNNFMLTIFVFIICF